MKRLGTALALLFGLAGASSAQGNLIALNPGFELGSPAGWYMWIDERSGGNAVFETVEAAHSGGYALQMTVKRPTREVWQIQMGLPKWDCKPNTHYRLSFWAKGPGTFKVTAVDATRGYAYINGFEAPAATDWTKISGEFSTADQSGSGSVGLNVGIGKQAGIYLLDDFLLEEVGPVAR